jgi:NADH dehydrogenase FAD-containing subunit
MNPTKRILIIGGGFAGVYTALHLDKVLAGETRVEVTILSSENFMLFTPMLHEVAASDLSPTDIVCNLRRLFRRVQFLEAEVEKIDLSTHRVSVAHGGGYVQANVTQTVGAISVTGSVTAGSRTAADNWAKDKRQFAQK